ncbi:MAG: YkgJ family cysteine cluster protein [Candidatus Aminicenantales bacterium]
MDESGLPSSLLFNLQKNSPFSFKCQACGACCYNKSIPVSSDEVSRIARRLGLGRREFFRIYIEENHPVLQLKPDGSCIFLGPGGCSIYPDRPFVCRLFPLGYIIDKAGRVNFGVMPLHPDCLGVLGTESTVWAYLRSQGISFPFPEDKSSDNAAPFDASQLGKKAPGDD